MTILVSILIAFVGSLSDEARFAVCDNTNIEVMAEEQGYIVFEDCSFVMED